MNMQTTPRYKCVNGHDRCNQMYPGPNCPYCEIEPEPVLETEIIPCVYCGKDVLVWFAKDGGVVSDSQYVLIADWVVHSKCYDEMCE